MVLPRFSHQKEKILWEKASQESAVSQPGLFS